MSEIEFVDDVTVELVDSMGSDAAICQAARVSTIGQNDERGDGANRGLINYLVANRHGSPLEATSLKFFVELPIFAARELVRHRIGVSLNEVSGRYRVLEPRFYVPKPDRKLVNVGTSARPEFTPGDEYQVGVVREMIEAQAHNSWIAYQEMLRQGIANEVARMVLPVNICTAMYITLNARSLMHFLSLRVDSPDSAVRSRPQWEIQLVAERMEAEFARLFPITHEAFVKAGRISP